jgi:glucose/arabinose dehydrogenase
MIRIIFSFLLCFSLNTAAQSKIWARIPAGAQTLVVEKIFSGDDVIWGFDFLDASTLIFTEREGRLYRLNLVGEPKALEIKGVPAVWDKGQGGLLDVRRHPTLANQIFFTYSAPVGKSSGATALATAEVDGDKLKNFKQLFISNSPTEDGVHFGSRIEFDGQGHLFFAIGDRGERDQVQNLAHHTGKMLRLRLDGSVPTDNPFVKTKDARPEIWSIGHRSPQGLVFDPKAQILWEAEMGPRGGDELNVIKKGANYGWPDVTYGREYYGLSIGVPSKVGIEEPAAYWVPSISPSAITIYDGDRIPSWKNNLFIGTLSGTHLRRLVLDGMVVKQQEELLKGLGQRFRAVRTAPDGSLYFSTDAGNIGRIY